MFKIFFSVFSMLPLLVKLSFITYRKIKEVQYFSTIYVEITCTYLCNSREFQSAYQHQNYTVCFVVKHLWQRVSYTVCTWNMMSHNLAWHLSELLQRIFITYVPVHMQHYTVTSCFLSLHSLNSKIGTMRILDTGKHN